VNLGEPMDSKGVVGSSQSRSFLTPKSRVFFGGLAREVQKRETGSIRYEGGFRGGYEGSWSGS